MNRLTTSLLIVVLLTTIGLGWLFDHGFEKFRSESTHQAIDKVRVFELFATALSQTIDQFESLDEFQQHWSQSQPSDSIQLQLRTLSALPLPSDLRNQVIDGEPLVLESEQYFTFYLYLKNHSQVLLLQAPSNYLESAQEKGDVGYTLLFYLVLAMLIGIGFLPLARQLYRLRSTAIAFGRGDLEQRIPSSKFSYIAEIEYEFNQMAQRIEDLVSDVKLLGSAVSHDLRTPLAKLRFGLDTLQEETDPQQREIYIAKLNNNLDQMSDLLEVLLSYARMDQARLEMELELLRFDTLIKRAAARIETASIKITIKGPREGVNIIADRRYLTMMIDNLLGNAIKHAKSKVSIQMTCLAQSVELVVEDDGSGVPEDIGKNCFKPFVRGTNPNSSGYGMGLAIVSRICHWHRGTIELRSHSELGGACFVVDLPDLKTTNNLNQPAVSK